MARKARLDRNKQGFDGKIEKNEKIYALSCW